MQLIHGRRCRCNESSNRCIWCHALNALMHDFVNCPMKQCYMNHWFNVTMDQYREGSKLMSHWNSRSWITGHLNPKHWTKQAADKNQWYYRQIIPGTHEPICQMQRCYEPMSQWATNIASAHESSNVSRPHWFNKLEAMACCVNESWGQVTHGVLMGDCQVVGGPGWFESESAKQCIN